MTFRIEHRIGIAAPAAEMWELVYDIAGWPNWTDLYTAASGKIAIGETLHFTYRIGERAPMSIDAVVYDWVPEAQLAWKAQIGPRLRSLRYVEIEKLTETSCILANGDYYSGWTFLISKAMRRDIRAGFERMNENAKRLVEAAWIAKGGQAMVEPDPTPSGPITIQPLMRPTRATGAKMWGLSGGGGFGPRLQK